MTERGKVKAGLECLTHVNFAIYKTECQERNCPYKDAEQCDSDVMVDALNLLESQEPRVFGVGDFYGEEFGYLEYKTSNPGFSDFELSPVLISDIDEENVTVIFRSGSVLKLPIDKINKSWRIWSDYPSHKLLTGVNWDG